jgi:hypothetical protein
MPAASASWTNGSIAEPRRQTHSRGTQRQSSRQRDQATATIMTFVSLVKVTRQLRR